MKKQLSILMVFAFIFTMFAGSAFAVEGKIGFVDVAKVFDDYQKTKEFDKTLEAKGSQKQAERDRMVNEIKKLRDEAELLGAKAKDEKQAVVDEKIKALQDYDRTTRDMLRKERDGMVRDILKEIDTIIQSYGKTNGYSFIFNDKALVFKTDGADLTAQISKALNDSYVIKKK